MTSAGEGNAERGAAGARSVKPPGPLRGTDPQRAASLSETSTRPGTQPRPRQSSNSPRPNPASQPGKGRQPRHYHWVRRYILFHPVHHLTETPASSSDERGEPEINAFLTDLAPPIEVSTSTQNLVGNSLLFLHRHILRWQLEAIGDIVLAKAEPLVRRRCLFAHLSPEWIRALAATARPCSRALGLIGSPVKHYSGHIVVKRFERPMRTIILTLLFAFLGGCAAAIPFSSVSLDMEPTVTSERSAKLELVTGAVAGSGSTIYVPISPIVMPMKMADLPQHQFRSEDQREFIEVLKSELLRLKVFREVAIAPDGRSGDMTVTVIFEQTYHETQIQEYTLDVVLKVNGGKEPLLRRYRVNSNEGATTWERLNTNAHEGKVKAVRKLLEKLVPDIQGYVAMNG